MINAWIPLFSRFPAELNVLLSAPHEGSTTQTATTARFYTLFNRFWCYGLQSLVRFRTSSYDKRIDMFYKYTAA